MSKHTPTPWRKSGPFASVSAPGMPCIADCGSRSDATAQANAEFIVRACNCHAELLAALERVAAWEADPDRYAGDLAGIAHDARAAIAKAKGGADA